MTAFTSLPTAAPSPQRPWFQQLGQTLKALFITNTEISIKTMVDRSGQTWYRAYDPQTRQTQWFTTEAEVLAWLDNPVSL